MSKMGERAKELVERHNYSEWDRDALELYTKALATQLAKGASIIESDLHEIFALRIVAAVELGALVLAVIWYVFCG